MAFKKNEPLPTEVENTLIKNFKKRAATQGHKVGTKSYTDAQQEYFIGAVTALDTILENTQSCITPNILYSIMHGEEIKPQAAA